MPKFAQMTLRRHARAQPSEGRRRCARLCRGHPRLAPKEGVDGRNKSGHDERGFSACREIASRSLSSGRPQGGPVGSQ